MRGKSELISMIIKRVCECCFKMVQIYVLIKYFMSRKKNRIRVEIYIFFDLWYTITFFLSCFFIKSCCFFFWQIYLHISGRFYRFLRHSIVISRRYLFTSRALSSNTISKLYYNVTTQHFNTEKFKKRKVFITRLFHFTSRTLAHIFPIQFSLAFFHQSN